MKLFGIFSLFAKKNICDYNNRQIDKPPFDINNINYNISCSLGSVSEVASSSISGGGRMKS